MAKYIASRLVGTYTPTGGTAHTFGITGFSVTGGDRNAIDITTGANDRRNVVPGLAAPLTATVNFVYEDNITTLDAALTDCDGGTLTIASAIDDGACSATNNILNGISVFCTGYSVEAELDGVVTGTATFTRMYLS